MLLRFAWRNVWRNRRRTLLTALALAFGVGAITYTHAMAEAMYGQMIELATRGFLGHLQIRGEGYLDDPRLTTVVPDPEAVEASLRTAVPGARAARRVAGFGLAGTESRSAGVMILGVEPSREGEAFLGAVEGRALGDAPAREAQLGRKLAERLGARPGDDLVLVSEAADGSVANDRYRVVGLTEAGSAELADRGVFLHLADAQAFFVLGRAVHQVVVSVDGGRDIPGAVRRLRAAAGPGLEVLAWNEIMPEIERAIAADRQGTFFADLIVFLIVVLGIFNTMTMATFERTREFGVMASLGTTRGRVVGLVVAESLLLGAVGLVVGLAASAVLLHFFGRFDLSGMEGLDIFGIRYPPEIRFGLERVGVASAALTALVTALFGGIFPAVRAARMRPIEATRSV